MHNATCVGTQTSKVPTRVTLLFISILLHCICIKNKAKSEQEAVLSDKFLLCIQMIYNLGLLFLKSIIDSVFWADFFGIWVWGICEYGDVMWEQIKAVYIEEKLDMETKYECKLTLYLAFNDIKHNVSKIGAHDVWVKSLTLGSFAYVVGKFLPRIKGRKVNFLNYNCLEKGLVLNFSYWFRFHKQILVQRWIFLLLMRFKSCCTFKPGFGVTWW